MEFNSTENQYTDCCSGNNICSVHDFQKLDELTYNIKEVLTTLSSKKVANLRYGYYCGEDIDEEIKALNVYKKSLDRIKLSYLHINKSCLSDETIQKIVEKVSVIVGKNSCAGLRQDIVVDDSLINAYLLRGPRCVTYDSYNKFASYLCGKLGFTVTAEREQCNITFAITRKILSCNLLYSLSVRREMCDLKYTVKRKSVPECKIDWKILVEKTKCDLEYRAYVNFVNKHDLSYPIIEEIYRSGLTLAEVDGEAIICTPIGDYKLTEITPTSLEELLNAGYVVSLNRHDLKDDYTRY